MIINDHEYFAGREQEEDDAARSATCIEERICHQKLADAYRRRCEDIFAATNHNYFATPAGYPTTTRQPIVISKLPLSPQVQLRHRGSSSRIVSATVFAEGGSTREYALLCAAPGSTPPVFDQPRHLIKWQSCEHVRP